MVQSTDFKKLPPIVEGDDVTYEIAYKDGDGDAVDITGWTFWLTIKDSKSDSDANAVIQKTVTTHTTPASGLTEITLTSSDTSGVSGTKHYDLQVKKGDGSIQTVMIGKVKFVGEVTQSS